MSVSSFSGNEKLIRVGIKEEKILIIRFSDKFVYYDSIDDNSEVLNRIFKQMEFLRKKHQQLYPLSHSELLELFESEKFLDREIFGTVKAVVFIIDSINISDISCTKFYFDLSLQRLDQYSPNASIFFFQPKANLMTINQKEEVQKTLNEFLSSGVKKHLQYFSDANEIVQKLREIA